MAASEDDLVRLASDLLDARASAPVFISIDGRTVAPTLVGRAVRGLVDARLAAGGGAPVEVALSDVTEHVLAWGSVVLAEDAAARLIDALAAEGWLEVVRRDGRRLWLRLSPLAGEAP
ncbi:MAG: hypothetical protein KIT58_16595 [Planctomycetota bacterium]|nr:hypothetical protein [Planctomycetota bacterium]